jgi:excisionase family DNA binding protein
MGDVSEYVTATEAAELIGVTKSRLNQLCADERLKFIWAGKQRLFLRKDVEAFAKLDRPSHRPRKRG